MKEHLNRNHVKWISSVETGAKRTIHPDPPVMMVVVVVVVTITNQKKMNKVFINQKSYHPNDLSKTK